MTNVLIHWLGNIEVFKRQIRARYITMLQVTEHGIGDWRLIAAANATHKTNVLLHSEGYIRNFEVPASSSKHIYSEL